MNSTRRILTGILGSLLLATGITVPAHAAALPEVAHLKCDPNWPAPRDYTCDGNPDVMALDGHGTLWLYPGDGDGGFLPRVRSATGWHYTAIIPTRGLLYGVFARDTAGTLWAIPSNGHAGWGKPVRVGGGWNQMTSIIDESFHGNLLAIDRSGTLWSYPYWPASNAHALRWLPRQRVGTGWGGRMLVDLCIGGGWPRFYARDAHTGVLWPYSDDQHGIRRAAYNLGSGWGRYTRIVEAGDWENVDGLSDLVATDTHGDLWYFPSGGSPGARVKIGHGFTGYAIY